MKIEIKEKGSKEFYKEVINLSSQYRYLVAKKDYKLKDYFSQFKKLLIAGCIVLGLLIVMCIFWGFKTLDYIAIIVLGITMLMCGAYVSTLNKYLQTMMAEAGDSVLTLDKEGVELERKDAQQFRISWSNIDFVVCNKESLAFVPKLKTGVIIATERKYEDQITDWLKENKPEIEIRYN